MSIIKLNDVHYSYKSKYQTVNAINGISCEFFPGKIYAIVGKSGSGKTTMLSLMAGLDIPTSGSVEYDGRSTGNMDLDEYRRRYVSVIYQSFHLFPLMTNAENVMYPMELSGMNPKTAREKAEEYITSVGLPATVCDRFPGMLSGGEQQRVAIARGLAMDTKLILADEPTGNLDTENSTNIIDILTKLAHEKNYCVIIITHDVGILDRMDVVYRMIDGKLYDTTGTELSHIKDGSGDAANMEA